MGRNLLFCLRHGRVMDRGSLPTDLRRVWRGSANAYQKDVDMSTNRVYNQEVDNATTVERRYDYAESFREVFLFHRGNRPLLA